MAYRTELEAHGYLGLIGQTILVASATMDGAEIGRGQGRDVLDHPFHAVAWLADHLASSGSGLCAGDIVMTGSIITTKFPDAPCRYRFELGELGAVEVSIK